MSNHKTCIVLELDGLTIATDPPEKINKCLSCTKPDCDECMSAGYHPNIKRRENTDELRMFYWERGMPDCYIARMVGVCAAAIGYWRKKHGLPAN